MYKRQLLALGGGGVYVFLHPELINKHLVAHSDNGRSTTAKASVGTLNNKDDDKKRKDGGQSRQTQNNLENSIRKRFGNLLQEWQKIVSP